MFSGSTQMLDIIQDYLGYRRYSYERLDGSIRGEDRIETLKRFTDTKTNGSSSSPAAAATVFLLSTRCGGVGLNLAVADVVIFFDLDWNPQSDLQVSCRSHWSCIASIRCTTTIYSFFLRFSFCYFALISLVLCFR